MPHLAFHAAHTPKNNARKVMQMWDFRKSTVSSGKYLPKDWAWLSSHYPEKVKHFVSAIR